MTIDQARNSKQFANLVDLALERIRAKYPYIAINNIIRWHPLGWEYGKDTIEAFEATFIDPQGPNHIVVRIITEYERILIMKIDDDYSPTMGWHNDSH